MITNRILYISAIFISALLLFLVQPMIAKMILPQLGGSPSVWQTVMLLFQSLLLFGYAYVCYSSKFFSLKTQKYSHIILTALAMIFLPLSLYLHDIVERTQFPVIWLFISLTFSVGLPFFILSTNAPLLQRWFSFSKDPSADNPYFLYSASNVGSLIALLSYPFIIEPYISLNNQTLFWSILYVGFFLLISFVALRVNLDKNNKEKTEIGDIPSPPLKTQIYWGVLSFIPSSLMLGVTTYVTTDVASFPLLWVLPLALYLTSFILVFAKGMPLYNTCKYLSPAAIALPILLWIFDINYSIFDNYIITVSLYFISFFIIAVAVHGRLSSFRPKAQNLTYFYMWMSIGGALGGVFNALISPVIFNYAIEYHFVLLLSVFALGSFKEIIKVNWVNNIIYGLSIITIILFGLNYLETSMEYILILIIILGAMFFKYDNVFLRSVISVIAISISYPLSIGYDYLSGYNLSYYSFFNENEIYRDRNFFGISVVNYNENVDALEYFHGTTFHGAQYVDPQWRLSSVSYYQHLLDDFKYEVSDDIKTSPFAVIGLGVGTLACFASEGQKSDLYEIDPIVIKLAKDNTKFTYLQDCEGEKNVILGDARLKVASAEDNYYGIMFIDAYSSDALPVHLLTEEAFLLYVSKLKNNGIIAFNISNRHLDLLPVLSSFANKHGFVIYNRDYEVKDNEYLETLATSSNWVIMSRNKSYFPSEEFLAEHGWEKPYVDRYVHWTDDFSSVVSIMY